jgi:hypothetical protein
MSTQAVGAAFGASRVPRWAARASRRQRDAATWLVLVAYVAVAKVVVDVFLPNAFASDDQRDAFSWAVIGTLSLLGLVGVWLATRTGFPAAWGEGVPLRRRLAWPFGIGLGVAALGVVVDLATGHEFTRLNAAAHGVGQQYSDPLSMLVIFSAVPVLVEAIYRLIPLPILLWLISNLVLRGRWQSPVYWLLAVPLSLWEPITQTIVVPDIGPQVFAREVALGFALNFTQAWFFRKYGFVSSIAVREGYYLLWHVLYVH